MSRSLIYFSKVPGQSIFRGQQVDLLSWLCFIRCLLLPFFAFFLHCSQLLRGALCHGPTLVSPLQKSETDSKERSIFFRNYFVFGTKNQQNQDRFKVKIFLKITMFLKQKVDKIKIDLKL